MTYDMKLDHDHIGLVDRELERGAGFDASDLRRKIIAFQKGAIYGFGPGFDADKRGITAMLLSSLISWARALQRSGVDAANLRPRHSERAPAEAAAYEAALWRVRDCAHQLDARLRSHRETMNKYRAAIGGLASDNN